MISILIALAVLLGAGGTMVASDAARPGDLLFPVDRAVEEVRATFATGEGKAELKIKFAEERLGEIESILEDESATTTSRGVSDEAKQNLLQALDILTNHLADIHGAASSTPGIAQAISAIEERLQRDAGGFPQELKIKIRDDRGRIELKTEEGKIKVKIDSDGEIEVETESEEEDEDHEDDRKDKKGSNSGTGSFSTSTKSESEDDDDDDNATSTKSDDSDDDGDDVSSGEDSESDDDDDSSDDSNDDDDDDSNSGSSGSNSGSGSSDNN